MIFLFLTRRNRSLSHCHIHYTLKSKRRGKKQEQKNIPCPILSPSEFTLLLPSFSLSVIYPEMLVMLRRWILCARKIKNASPAASPHLPAPRPLFRSPLLVSLLWMSGLSVPQPDMISVSDTTPRSRRGARRAGEDAQPCIEVKGKKAQPPSSEAPWLQSSL